uniref:START domain-containing protein n=1 Tax=Globisporangium ultimum (strain ATCC 200006 / CBS 805.95 / DAOM BR144) TaxID=431595 RepID=K3W9I7_GLOUD
MDAVNEAWPRGGAIATFNRLSMDTVDENVLLAETEDLLATLDATAFAAESPMAPRDRVTYHPWNVQMESATSAPDSRREPEPQVKKKRIQSLEKVKNELNALRKVAVELEAQLASLQQSNSSTVHKQQIVLASWQRIADRQRQLRDISEAENQKLKSMLFDIFNTTDRLALYATGSSSLLKLPNYRHGPPKLRICMNQGDVQLSETCEALLDRLDVAYADMDAVFRANGLNESLMESRSFIKNRMLSHGADESGTPYVELSAVGVSPIPAALMGRLTWEAMRKWHHKDNAYSHPCGDRPDDTFVVNYRVMSKATTVNSGVVLTLAMRRYFMRDRFVFVWTSQSDGEKDLAGTFTKETGWIAINSVPGPESSGSSITVLQSCMQIIPNSKTGSPMPSEKANALLSSVMAGVEEDASFIHQMVESAFLQRR